MIIGGLARRTAPTSPKARLIDFPARDARSWHAVAQRTVTHDRVTTGRMRHLVVRYNRLVIRTRRSEQKLLAGVRRAQTAGAQLPSVPSFASVAAPASSPAPAAAPAPAPPSTHTS